MFNSASYKFFLLVIIISGLVASPANSAWRANWQIGADVEYSDNVDRADDD